MPKHHTHNLQQLKNLGWQWHDNGAIVQVTGTDQEGQPVTCGVFVPVDRIWAAFQKHLGAVGCPFPPGVGAPFSVGSLFSWVKGAAKDVGGAVGSAGKEVVHVANKYGGHAVQKLGKEAMESKTFRGVVDVAAIAVPALAPAAAGLETAHQIYDKVELGKHAAHAIAQGFHTPENEHAVLEAHDHLNALGDIIHMAHQGHPQAQEIIGGLHVIQGLPIPPPSPLTPPLPPHHPHHRHHHHLHPGVPAPPVDVTAPRHRPSPPSWMSCRPGSRARPRATRRCRPRLRACRVTRTTITTTTSRRRPRATARRCRLRRSACNRCTPSPLRRPRPRTGMAAATAASTWNSTRSCTTPSRQRTRCSFTASSVRITRT